MSKTQQHGIDILSEITKKDIERNLQNINANWSPRHGWHLKRNTDSDLTKPLHILNEKSEQNSTTNN